MAAIGRHSITDVKILPEPGLEVSWGDGHVSRFPAIWLRMACSCRECGSTESAVRNILLTDIPDNPAIAAAPGLAGWLSRY